MIGHAHDVCRLDREPCGFDCPVLPENAPIAELRARIEQGSVPLSAIVEGPDGYSFSPNIGAPLPGGDMNRIRKPLASSLNRQQRRALAAKSRRG